jgi:hypothetical protein
LRQPLGFQGFLRFAALAALRKRARAATDAGPRSKHGKGRKAAVEYLFGEYDYVAADFLNAP